MRWLRLHRKKILDRHLHFRRKSSVLRNTTDSYEGGRFLLWSTSIFEQPESYEAVQGLSDLFNISLQNDKYQGFRCTMGPRFIVSKRKTCKWSWKDCTSQNCSSDSDCIWPCMTKRLPETMGNHVIKGWRHLWGYTLIRRWELVASEPEMKQWKEEQLPRAEKERKPTLRGRWENALNRRQMDNALKGTHVVQVMNLYLETDTRLREEKGNRLLLAPPIQRQRLTGKNIEKIRQQRTGPLERKGQIPLPKQKLWSLVK